jgi:hypothetical protein
VPEGVLNLVPPKPELPVEEVANQEYRDGNAVVAENGVRVKKKIAVAVVHRDDKSVVRDGRFLPDSFGERFQRYRVVVTPDMFALPP